ncbi:MAG: hypothetical protein ACYCRH_03345 [Acidiferrobacteraceae bacterium]
MDSRKTFTETEVSEILMRIERVAVHGGVDAVLTLTNTVRAVIPALAHAVRSGAERGTLAAMLMGCGFSKGTAYRAVRLACARARQAGPASGTDTAKDRRTRAVPPVQTASVVPGVPAPKPAVTAAGPEPPLEHYRADALPPHIRRGVALSSARDGGRVWIDCLPFDANREAPFGTDADGAPWAPYGRDSRGRFLNYVGAALGATGRIGRGHFAGEPDEP